jgi:hypothetical protein
MSFKSLNKNSSQMKLTLLLSLVLVSYTVFGQEQLWIQQQPGGDYNHSYGLEIDSNNNSYVLYYKYIPGVWDGVWRINQYDPEGSLIHSTLIDSGGTLSNSGFTARFKLTSDSAFYVIFGANPIIANKFSKQGDLLWTKTVNNGSSYFLDTWLDKDENIYVLLDNYAISTSKVIKFHSSGTLLWSDKYDPGFPAEIQPVAMAVDDAGNAYVTGVIIHLDGSNEFNTLILKYSATGNLEWAKEIQLPDTQEYGADLIFCEGNLYVTARYDDINNGINYVLLYKYDPAGNQVWIQQSTPSNSGACEPIKIMCDNTGNLDIIGRGGDQAIVTIQYDSSGTLNWSDEYYYFTTVGPWMNDADLDDNGNIVIAGKESYWSNDGNFWLLKYASSGQLLWDTTYDSNPALLSNDEIKFVQFDYAGNIIVAGITDDDTEDGALEGRMTTVAKYSDDFATSVHSTTEHYRLFIQPNPVSEILFFGGANPNDLFVTDISGKIIECPSIGQSAIDVSRLPGGIYFLWSVNEPAIVKFIKQ